MFRAWEVFLEPFHGSRFHLEAALSRGLSQQSLNPKPYLHVHGTY